VRRASSDDVEMDGIAPHCVFTPGRHLPLPTAARAWPRVVRPWCA